MQKVNDGRSLFSRARRSVKEQDYTEDYVKLPPKTKDIADYVNKWLQKLNLQPLENHTHESYVSVIQSLDKFEKDHNSTDNKVMFRKKKGKHWILITLEKSERENQIEIQIQEERSRQEGLMEKQSIFQKAVNFNSDIFR